MSGENSEEIPAGNYPDRGRRVLRIILACWLAGIALVTLSPVPGRGQSLNLRPGYDLAYGWSLLNVGVNVVLFVPLGVVAARARVGLGRWWRTLAFALALSTAIEVVQYYAGTGRAADVNDVLANGLGALAGCAAAAVVAGSRGRARPVRHNAAHGLHDHP